MRTQVVHVRDRRHNTVFIGRPSLFGNPFRIGVDGTREEVIERYRRHLLSSPQLLQQLPLLVGRRLACFCVPETCHGDVLVEVIRARGLET